VAITGSFDLRVTLSIVLDQVINMLGVDSATILLLDGVTGELSCAAARGFTGNAIHRSRFHMGEGLAGRSAATRQIVEVSNLNHKSTSSLDPAISGEGFVSYCALPLIAKGNVLGVLEVYHRSTLAFDADWRGYYEVLGGQAAIAIDSSLMFENLQRKNAELMLAYDVTIEGWSRALDLRDKETEGHSQRVADITVKLAREYGMAAEELIHVRRGSLLHDIGKLAVPDHILLKPGQLTEDEWKIMRKHPQYAFDWLSTVEFLQRALDIPYCHHEKWDGSGYPRGLKGEQIPLPARLFALADVWDGLTSDRPYREAWSPQRTMEHILSGSGTHFDPEIVELFHRMMSSSIGGDLTVQTDLAA
jgi:putative nucleotidyltransferase with HDIG domain